MKKQRIKNFLLSILVISVVFCIFGCKKNDNYEDNNISEKEENDIVTYNTEDKIDDYEDESSDDEVLDNPEEDNFKNFEDNKNDTIKEDVKSIQSTVSEILGISDNKNTTTENHKNNNSHKSNDENSKYFELIDGIVDFADEFYRDNYSKTRLVTKNGRLYNKASENYIDINYLIGKGLGEEYKDVPCDILLIKPSDLKDYKNMSIKNTNSKLSIFISMKVPSEDKYILASSSDGKGILTSDEYGKLMYKYSQNHGTPLDVNPYSEKYQDILGFIKLYDGAYTDYFVRGMKTDNKYAFVTLSPTYNTNALKQYVLVNKNNFWEVMLSDVHTASRVPVYVNEQIPDLNLDLLPRYEISDYNLASYDSNDIYYTLLKNGYISGMEDITYIAGAGKYYYAKDYNGNIYLLNYSGGVWHIRKPKNYKEAYDMMMSEDRFAPTFILLYE